MDPQHLKAERFARSALVEKGAAEMFMRFAI